MSRVEADQESLGYIVRCHSLGKAQQGNRRALFFLYKSTLKGDTPTFEPDSPDSIRIVPEFDEKSRNMSQYYRNLKDSLGLSIHGDFSYFDKIGKSQKTVRLNQAQYEMIFANSRELKSDERQKMVELL